MTTKWHKFISIKLNIYFKFRVIKIDIYDEFDLKQRREDLNLNSSRWQKCEMPVSALVADKMGDERAMAFKSKEEHDIRLRVPSMPFVRHEIHGGRPFHPPL